MADLTIRVGDLRFEARWEEAAPRTREAMRAWLPIRTKLIHCKWSGESTWVPFGDERPAVGFENHTSYPAPGDLLIYTGDISECEILFPYGACSFSSRVGPSGVATVPPTMRVSVTGSSGQPSSVRSPR